MALFGKVDVESKNLWKITRFYQVLSPDEEFPDFTLKKFLETELYAFLVVDNPSRVTAPHEPEEFEKYYKLHKLVRAFLSAKADNGMIEKRVMIGLKRFLSTEFEGETKYFAMFLPEVGRQEYLTDETPDPQTMVPVNEVSFGIRGNSTPEETMLDLFKELRELLVWKQFSVARCEECHNPFVPSRRGQNFCSHRCGNRASARRRYNDRKETTHPASLTL